MRTVRQDLLVRAYEKVSARASESDEKAKKTYGIWCHGLPGLIRTSGLAGALSFLVSKEADKGKELGFKWLLDDLMSLPGMGGANLVGPTNNQGKRTVNGQMETSEYLLLTRRTLQALPYFKRFSESLLGVTAAEAGGNDE